LTSLPLHLLLNHSFMKKVLLLTWLIVPILCVAQYHPVFDSDSIRWHAYYQGFGGSGTTSYHTTGDTIIAGQLYHKIGTGITAQFVREDTSNQRVYQRRASGVDSILYDFSLNPGDQFYLWWPGLVFSGIVAVDYYSGTYNVDSIEIINTLAGPRKRLWLTRSTGGAYLNWLEGVGSMDQLFYYANLSYGAFDNTYYQTICQFKGGVQTFHLSPDYDCELGLVGIEQFTQTEFSLSPNPFSDFIRVEIHTRNSVIRICNSIGQTILQRELTSTETLDVSKLAAGLYYVTVKNGNGIETKRLLKQ
jgi:hypothetical protein